jgi:hypothetical protein
MTLLLTELGKHGVVMVAESAIRSEERMPYSRKPAFRLAYGVRKIVPVPRLHCAVGIWGVGAIETKEPFACTPDVWIADFLETHQELTSLGACAEVLTHEFQAVLRDLDRVTNRIIDHAPDLGAVRAGLWQRAEYLSACVRFLCDFERVSGYERILTGGDTSFAMIGPDGVIRFKPPYEGVSGVN